MYTHNKVAQAPTYWNLIWVDIELTSIWCKLIILLFLCIEYLLQNTMCDSLRYRNFHDLRPGMEIMPYASVHLFTLPLLEGLQPYKYPGLPIYELSTWKIYTYLNNPLKWKGKNVWQKKPGAPPYQGWKNLSPLTISAPRHKLWKFPHKNKELAFCYTLIWIMPFDDWQMFTSYCTIRGSFDMCFR